MRIGSEHCATKAATDVSAGLDTIVALPNNGRAVAVGSSSTPMGNVTGYYSLNPFKEASRFRRGTS